MQDGGRNFIASSRIGSIDDFQRKKAKNGKGADGLENPVKTGIEAVASKKEVIQQQ